MKALAFVACALLAACTPNRTRTDVELVPEAVEVVRKVPVPVDERLTTDIPCAERENDTVRAIATQAEQNTAACKAYRANMQGIRDTHPKE